MAVSIVCCFEGPEGSSLRTPRELWGLLQHAVICIDSITDDRAWRLLSLDLQIVRPLHRQISHSLINADQFDGTTFCADYDVTLVRSTAFEIMRHR